MSKRGRRKQRIETGTSERKGKRKGKSSSSSSSTQSNAATCRNSGQHQSQNQHSAQSHLADSEGEGDAGQKRLKPSSAMCIYQSTLLRNGRTRTCGSEIRRSLDVFTDADDALTEL